jgi:hypothetical protein
LKAGTLPLEPLHQPSNVFLKEEFILHEVQAVAIYLSSSKQKVEESSVNALLILEVVVEAYNVDDEILEGSPTLPGSWEDPSLRLASHAFTLT